MLDIFNRKKLKLIVARLESIETLIAHLSEKLSWTEEAAFDLCVKYRFIREELDDMAKLTTKERKKIPSSEFGEPGSRKFPINDKAHAKNAKARASEMEHKGKLSSAIKSKIDAKANRKLGRVKKVVKSK